MHHTPCACYDPVMTDKTTKPPRLEDQGPGQRILITEFSESPLSDIERTLQCVAQPVPDIDTLKPSDVLIKVESGASRGVDVLMTSGQYQHQPRLPFTPGQVQRLRFIWREPAIDESIQVGGRVYVD